jgi:hypothetical protein
MKLKTQEALVLLQSLETQRDLLHAKIQKATFPCPECGENVKDISWDRKEGGCCPHCVAWIEASEMTAFVEAHHADWKAMGEYANQAREVRLDLHVRELRKGLIPFHAFVHKGYPHVAFTEAVYRMLKSSFHFIAHGSLDGFWTHHFGDTAKTRTTLEWIERFESVAAHSTAGFGDLERDIRRVLSKLDAFNEIREKHEHEVQKREQQEYDRLHKKFSMAPK